MKRGNTRFRHSSHDYRIGDYFVTICCRDRKCDLGTVRNGEIELSEIGIFVREAWLSIPIYSPNVKLGEFVIMPNHIHGILHVRQKETIQFRPNEFAPPVRGSLGGIIGRFKTAVTKWCRKNNWEHFSWQSRYHDNIIRNTDELFAIQKYISENPAKWEADKFNVELTSLAEHSPY